MFSWFFSRFWPVSGHIVHVHGYAEGRSNPSPDRARIPLQNVRDGNGDGTSRALLRLNMPYPPERATAKMKSGTTAWSNHVLQNELPILARIFHGSTVVKWQNDFGYRKNAG